MKDLINKIKASGGTKMPAGNNPDESTYSLWGHLIRPSTNALNTAEETIYFTVIIILFFVCAFFVIFNLIHLIRVFKNLDGSIYQTKHIIKKIVLMLFLIAADVYFFNYILVVTKII